MKITHNSKGKGHKEIQSAAKQYAKKWYHKGMDKLELEEAVLFGVNYAIEKMKEPPQRKSWKKFFFFQ